MNRCILVASIGLAIMAMGLINWRGCKHVPVKGTVEGKEHIPTRTYTQLLPVGKVLIPQIRTIPEQWQVKVGSKWIPIEKEEWERIQIGQYYEEKP